MYATPEELIQRHWRAGCKGFVLDCPRCGGVLKSNHNCVDNLLLKKQQQAQEILALEQEVQNLRGQSDQLGSDQDMMVDDFDSEEEKEEAKHREDEAQKVQLRQMLE